jgi:hypothetical protein
VAEMRRASSGYGPAWRRNAILFSTSRADTRARVSWSKGRWGAQLFVTKGTVEGGGRRMRRVWTGTL